MVGLSNAWSAAREEYSTSPELLTDAHQSVLDVIYAYARAAASVPSQGQRHKLLCFFSLSGVRDCMFTHRHPELFNKDAFFGPGGSHLKGQISSYDFATHSRMGAEHNVLL